MIAALLALALQAASAPLPPQDWSGLPTLAFVRATDGTGDVSGFVRGEVEAGRCAHAVPTPRGASLTVDLAVLATAQGQVRRIVPRAIGCAAVEQFAAGLVSSMARGNLAPAPADAWYRTSLTFVW